MKSKKGAIVMPKGYKANGLSCGIKKKGLLDLALLYSERRANAVALFTTNNVKAWPLIIGKSNLKNSILQAVIINSGNANCYNGDKNMAYCRDYLDVLSKEMQIPLNNILPSSTGVIGVDFKSSSEKIKKSIPKLVRNLSKQNGSIAAEAILTTDTKTKELYTEFEIGDKQVTLAVMAKGSGMIHPNMATMLVYFTTDCAISKVLLKKALKQVAAKTFNRMSIDNDMSTNDTVFILANGAAENQLIEKNTHEAQLFIKALTIVMEKLAKDIVLDGEGITKFVTVQVKNAKSTQDARLVTRAVSESLLCKTAWFGCDPNWGRILAAAGYSTAVFNPDKIDLFYDNTPVVLNGVDAGTPESELVELMKKDNFIITLDLKSGNYADEMWTNDISYEYVKINADYHT